ncbi:thioredoxin domain-containing protein [Hwangdonia lutea]|uniref:Thioredoxin domain-containing protein n=1 Tax=Hwangdonia lutea TaxID=3075823 RepID=A0AA97EPS2_9FLAO|nr:thioredoxin domain-containing protein [Hwangdonia sp. SCSIO 19198]WOD44841.1 thioredoxin domain-containing protein [Hwangdonia sp. SCSIO 19198]
MKRTVILSILLLNLLFSFSQTANKLITDEKGNELLLGEISKFDLTKNTFNTWFSKNYDDYLVNKGIAKQLKDSLNQYEIKAFLGTWCGDSKKEVPRFYKVLEAAKFPENQLQVIAVNSTKEAYKQSPDGEEKGLNIHRVPTFIFYKNGKEINRIVEHPKETFERDMLTIVSKNKYTPNYMAANYMYNLLNSKTINSLKMEESILVPRLAEFVKGSRELNTFGYSILRSNQIEKALYIFDLNTKIFPYKYNVYDSLGEAYFETKNYTEALKNYYKVLSLKPDDKNAREMVDKITKL